MFLRETMHCDIYKFNKKGEMYAYIARPNYPNDVNEITDALAVIPTDIRNSIGMGSFVMHLDLTTRERLARVDINKVRSLLVEQGYFLQFPPDPLAGLPTQKPAPFPFNAVDC